MTEAELEELNDKVCRKVRESTEDEFEKWFNANNLTDEEIKQLRDYRKRLNNPSHSL